MLARSLAFAAVLVVGAPRVRAECPTDVTDLPATGFLAIEARRAMAAYAGVPPAADPPSSEAHLGVAAGVRTDLDGDEDTAPATGTGSLAAQLLARRGRFTGCVSGDLLDARDGSAHLAASGQVPFMFTGLGFGVAVDRAIRLPLATRREFLVAPIDRVAGQVSVAFIDLDFAQGAEHARVLAMPVHAEWATARQSTAERELIRHAFRAKVSMFRFVFGDATGGGTLGIADATFDTILEPTMPERERASITRLSPVSLRVDREPWRFEVDGGALGLYREGIDCETQRCTRGFLAGALRRRIGDIAVGARAERTAFLDADDQPAIEDRATATLELIGETRTLTASGFVARAREWLVPGWSLGGGGRVGFAQSLGHDLSALVDAELARSDVQPAARALVSLAWRRSATR